MSFDKPTPLELAYPNLCASYCVIAFETENGKPRVCVARDPWDRMRREFPARYFSQLVKQLIWVADRETALKIKDSQYLDGIDISKAATREGIRFIPNDVMFTMARKVIEIAREELAEFKKTPAYKSQRKREREAIQGDRLMGIKSRTMRDFDDRLVKQITKRKLKEGL